MHIQIDVFKQIQLLRHGAQKTIQCDREYDIREFRSLCDSLNLALRLSAAHDHKENGLIENANRTLRSFFDRLRLVGPGKSLIPEALLRLTPKMTATSAVLECLSCSPKLGSLSC